MRVYIGVPSSWENIPTVFVQSLCDMEKPVDHTVRFVGGHSISEMRNAIVLDAMRGGYTHTFMLDADMTYPPDSLTRLLDANVDIISGLSCQRIPPYRLLFMSQHKEGDEYFILGEPNPPESGVHEVAAVGGAGFLARMDVYRTLEYPYFIGHGKDAEGNGVGEDIWFSATARRAGWKCHVDTGLRFGHLGHFAFTPSYDAATGTWDRTAVPVR